MWCKRMIAVAALAFPVASWGSGASAETIHFGVTKIANCAPIAIALAKGYFAAEGLQPQLTFFQAQAPVAVAVASGDLDFGDAAETAALYNLAAGGRLRIVASGANEAPTFHSLALIASNQAYAAGLKSPRDLPGHSFALTQMGSGLQYSLGEIAVKEGFDVNTVKLLPLQSNPNIASALSGGRADAAVFDSTNALPLIQKGDAKLLGWVGDLAGYTPAFLVFASRNMLDHHGDTVKRFLAAYRKATRDFYLAFTDAQGMRKDQPTAAATLDILAKWIGQPAARVQLGLPYFDRGGRVDMTATQKQIDWYRSIGAIKGKLVATAVVDKRFAAERSETQTAAH
ncbi:MAG TPA: ABC transporter substrate-binding protein [Stellaceae bacterium]|nr:ABC transporter substrate-binding protein [Stellaceae bacterium]